MSVAISSSLSRGCFSSTARPRIRRWLRRSALLAHLDYVRKSWRAWVNCSFSPIARKPRCLSADPTGVDMRRVVSTMPAIEDVESGLMAPDAATEAISLISQAPPAPTWLFALAAAAGAVALSVIFCGAHFIPVLIFVSAGTGAVLRRALSDISTNAFLQPLCAEILAGVIGALAVRYGLSSSLRLVAV